jgi:hypothetical protein
LENDNQIDLIKEHQLDLIDCKPCDYNRFTDFVNLSCIRPLYFSNQISILSTVEKNFHYDLNKLLSFYQSNVWFTLFGLILFLISFTAIKNPIRNSSWAFIDPLFREGNPRAIKCFSYSVYLVALIPFLNVISNELLVNLVAVKEHTSNTINDLLDPSIFVLLFDNKEYWEKEMRKLDDSHLKTDFSRLLSKVTRKSDINDLMELIQNKEKVAKIGRHFALIGGEHELKLIGVS